MYMASFAKCLLIEIWQTCTFYLMWAPPRLMSVMDFRVVSKSPLTTTCISFLSLEMFTNTDGAPNLSPNIKNQPRVRNFRARNNRTRSCFNYLLPRNSMTRFLTSHSICGNFIFCLSARAHYLFHRLRCDATIYMKIFCHYCLPFTSASLWFCSLFWF